jgi:hypothetical protein
LHTIAFSADATERNNAWPVENATKFGAKGIGASQFAFLACGRRPQSAEGAKMESVEVPIFEATLKSASFLDTTAVYFHYDV